MFLRMRVWTRLQSAAMRASFVRFGVVSLSAAVLMSASAARLLAQAPDPSAIAPHEASSIPLAIGENRGAAELEQDLRRLNTTASVMMIVAHPDDEDGPLLTYLSREKGVRAILYTLTRGEGGQNAMGAETYDALGLIRTNELLAADEYYGTTQMWGTQADFGFSKTQEESFARWNHDRVLYDAVLAVRRMKPEVIVATFVGAVSDGHGQHQVSGEIAQEVFKVAGDPKVFPDQLKDGIEPWQPLAVYGMIPFASITPKGIFDYATGKWAPVRFKNYITGEIITHELSTDVTIPVGTRDPVLGLSPVQIARAGWSLQKSQYGGGSPALSGPAFTSYHLWAVAPAFAAKAASAGKDSLFQNDRVEIPTSFAGLSYRAGATAPAWLRDGLGSIGSALAEFEAHRAGSIGIAAAHELAPIYKQTLDLRKRIAESSELSAQAKANLLLELDYKIDDFQSALTQFLGVDMIAFTAGSSNTRQGGSRGTSADETPRSVSPGETFFVRVHAGGAVRPGRHIEIAAPNAASQRPFPPIVIQSGLAISRIWLESRTGSDWQVREGSESEELDGQHSSGIDAATDEVFSATVPADAQPTEPYFTRPTIEQPYYDISNPAWRGRSFAPWPLEAWVEYTFDGVPIRLGAVVQTLQRIPGEGGVYQPLVVTPAIGVSITPEAQILPLDGGPLPVRVVVHTQSAAVGTVSLKLPAGWSSQPAEAHFQTQSAGDTEPILFSVSPDGVQTGAYTVQAVVQSDGATYTTGWQSIGYPGLRPYNLYKTAALRTRKIDVRLAPGLRIGYVMGAGDPVPEAIEELGVTPHLLSDSELASADLSAWNVIVIGIRAYSTRMALAASQQRLNDFVRNGGTLIVQYQSAGFPAPLPLEMGRLPEKVVDESAPVELLNPTNPLLRWPNVITAADFDGWVEERGHSFLDSWDSGYTALTQTADAGQDPQRGGLLVAHVGKGIYIYVAYALYRQLPELVPGSYRLLANLLSAGAAR